MRHLLLPCSSWQYQVPRHGRVRALVRKSVQFRYAFCTPSPGFRWFAKIQHLRGAEQFDGDNLLCLSENAQNFIGTGRTHTDKIFHTGGGGNGVDAGGMSQNFDLVDQGRRYILCDHKARVEARIRRQEKGRTAFVPIVWSHETINTPFRKTGQLRKRDGQHIESQGQWLPVKISAAQHIAILWKDERIIRHGIQFALKNGLSNIPGRRVWPQRPGGRSAAYRGPARVDNLDG